MSQVRIVKHAALCRLMLSALVACQRVLLHRDPQEKPGTYQDHIRTLQAATAMRLMAQAIDEARGRGITLAEPVKSPDGTCPTCGGTIG